MSFAMTQGWRSRLLRPRPVREDVYIQGLAQDELCTISEALDRGLKPAGFSVGRTAVILRFALNESRKPTQEERAKKSPLNGTAGTQPSH
jgi:hypothetical protein